MDAAPGALRVTHVITGIRPHGAELALLRLVRETSDRCSQHVVVISDSDELRDEFTQAGAAVSIVGLSRRAPNPFKLVRLVRAIRSSRPDVVQTWLPAADLLGGLATRLTSRTPVVWNVRHSEHQPGKWGWPTRLAIRLNALLSRWVPSRIVAVGDRPAELHASLGYRRDLMRVIHNGFEIPTGVVDRSEARRRLGLPLDSLVVCRLARFHDDKDFPTLFAAWASVLQRVPGACLALAGHGLDEHNPDLVALANSSNVKPALILLGPLDRPFELYAASDVTVSSSLAEGLPNVIGEAMSVGVPAVVTDVGDSAQLVGDTGVIVPPARPDRLADALVDLLSMDPADRLALGQRARQRVVEQFSMKAMGDAYVNLWSEVANVRD